MASFYVYIVYLFLILRQTCRFFFDVCMSMQVLMNCNVLDAMKVDAVNTGVCGFYATLYVDYSEPCIQSSSPLQDGKPVQPPILWVHQSMEADLF